MLYHTVVFTLIGISAISFVLSIVVVYNQWPYFFIVEESGLNDDEIATECFIDLLDAAEEKISISDHGNIMPKSIYENETVLDLVAKKLTENTDFSIECGFTSADINQFRERFEKHPRVTIERRDDEPDLEYPHYKIIDGGKKAYLSRHNLGSDNRKVQYYDFSNVHSRRGQAKVKENYIGDYLKDVELTFSRSGGQNA